MLEMSAYGCCRGVKLEHQQLQNQAFYNDEREATSLFLPDLPGKGTEGMTAVFCRNVTSKELLGLLFRAATKHMLSRMAPSVLTSPLA